MKALLNKWNTSTITFDFWAVKVECNKSERNKNNEGPGMTTKPEKFNFVSAGTNI